MLYVASKPKMRLPNLAALIAALLLPAAAFAQAPGPLAALKSESQPSCSKSLLDEFQVVRHGEDAERIPIWQVADGHAFFYEAGMAIDADGAPNAYHPDNIGLDDLKNAGEDGTWWALALDKDGEPYVQGPDDPFPGFYISTTALWDRDKLPTDPSRYVDASKIPYIVLPGSVSRQMGARLGDMALVVNRQNNKFSYAIFADIGPSVGEGSIALAENLGISSNARRGGARGPILYVVFPGSGNGRARPLEEINDVTEKLLQDSSSDLIKACTAN
jgi:hypothetical protein